MFTTTKRRWLLVAGFSGLFLWFGDACAQGRTAEPVARLADPAYRDAQTGALRARAEAARERARQWADRTGEPMRRETNGTAVVLVDYTEEDGPVYRKTSNLNAGISTRAGAVRAGPYFLSGTNITAALWDAGNVRATHAEFGGRISNMEAGAAHDHATHVAATMIAAGTDPLAIGMAPAARLDVYTFENDLAEMTSRAMAVPGEPGKLQVSVHAYNQSAGWDNGFSPVRWFGRWTNNVKESDHFGRYATNDVALDRLTYEAPYYLPVFPAGNDRADAAPASGTTFQYFSNNQWRTTTYNPSVHPFRDGWKTGGLDTIAFGATAKNILLVGAVNDAVHNGEFNINQATMTDFSSWGPTDDGRIKPDVVANGVDLYSASADGDNAYGGRSGASMAAANAGGSALLILERYAQRFPGKSMRASTLRGLIIHSADTLLTSGPNYRTGWGLMNTKAAVDLLDLHHANTNAGVLTEGRISTTNTVVNIDVTWSNTGPIRATLAWTDPPGVERTGLNNTNRTLRNDLNLRVISPNNTTFSPWVLNPATPTNPATTGNNIRDNVEQVLIGSPGLMGTYRVQITYSGSLSNNFQDFSVIVSGIKVVDDPATQLRLDGIFDWGTAELGQNRQRVITLHNDGNLDVTITNMILPEGFSGAWTGAIPGRSARDVPVAFAPASTGLVAGTWFIRLAETTTVVSRGISGVGAWTHFFTVTNPPGDIVVSNHIDSYTVRGVAGSSLVGHYRWTNSYNGDAGLANAQAQWSMSTIPLGVGTNTLYLFATNRPVGGVLSTDAASHAAYSGGWTNKAKGGSGFNTWILQTSGGAAGHFRATSAAHPNLNLGPDAWALWAAPGSEAHAFRPFTRPLLPGDTLRVAFENNLVTNGGSVGVALRNPDGEALVEFLLNGGDATYTIHDAETGRDTGIASTPTGLNLSLTLTGPDRYYLVAGGTTVTGTLAARADMSITRFQAWNQGAGAGTNHNVYINYLSVTSAPAPTLTTGATVRITRQPMVPIILASPIGFSGEFGQERELFVQAAGGEPLYYQWTKDGLVLPGATDPLLVFNPLLRSDDGSYWVVITNSVGSITSAPALVRVFKAEQEIDFPPPGDVAADATVPLAATALSGLPVSFSVFSGPGVVDGGSLSFTGAGLVRVVASQPGDDNWKPAPSVTNVVSVSKAEATILLVELYQVFNGMPREVSAETVPPGLAVSLTYDDTPEAAYGAGAYAIAAEIFDDMYFGSATGTLIVAKAIPGYTWTNPTPIVYGTLITHTQLNAMPHIDGEFEYDPPAQTLLNAGTNVLSAIFRPLDSPNYEVVTATVELVVLPAFQFIEFPGVEDQFITNVLGLAASASSGLPVAYQVVSGPASIMGSNVSFTGRGVVVVVAEQSGGGNWRAADPVTSQFTVFGIADINENGIPDDWELHHFGSLDAVTEDSDADEDGSLDWQEYIAGTDPNDPASIFQIFSDPETMIEGDAIVLRWSSASNRVYAVGRQSSLMEPFLDVTSGLVATPPINVFTNALPAGATWYYRVTVELEPE